MVVSSHHQASNYSKPTLRGPARISLINITIYFCDPATAPVAENEFKKGGGYVSCCKKQRIDSNELKKGGKYVSQQKSLKELKDELVGLINYAKAQTQLNNQNVCNNQNVRNGRGLVLPPFDQSKYTNTSAQTQHNNRDSHYHTRHERQPTGQFTKRYPKPHKRVLGFT